jgi:hypothetical protein
MDGETIPESAPSTITTSIDQCRTHEFVSELRQFLESQPPDLVMLVKSEVRRRPLPGADKPGTEEHRLSVSSLESTQVSHRVRGDLNSQFFVQLPRERAHL